LFILMFALAAFLSTLIGGIVIVRFRKALPYFFAFAAGSLVAVSFLDLLPESLEISNGIGISSRYIFITVVLSFFVYSLIERFFATHEIHGDEHGHIMGPIGAGSLVLHSFLDGIAIGAAFHVSSAIGVVVAFAVIFHDFTDGINTVTLMLKNKHKISKAIIFLIMDALAPVFGILVTFAVVIPEKALAFVLAIFVGEFLFIGASSLLPETREHDSWKSVVAMALGIALILALTSFISF